MELLFDFVYNLTGLDFIIAHHFLSDTQSKED